MGKLLMPTVRGAVVVLGVVTVQVLPTAARSQVTSSTHWGHQLQFAEAPLVEIEKHQGIEQHTKRIIPAFRMSRLTAWILALKGMCILGEVEDDSQ